MREPSLEEVLESGFSYLTSGMYTAIPGIVIGIRDGLASSYVDVQPTINLVSEDSDPLPRPAVLNVPLIFPISKSGGITFAVEVGDPVLLVYSMRGLDTWKRGDGSSVTPVDFRKMDGRDCIAIPGCHPIGLGSNNPSRRSNAHDTKDTVMVVGIGTGAETEVRLKPSGQVIVNAPVSAEVNSPDITLRGNVRIIGTLIVEKLLTFMQGIAGSRGTGTNTITGDFNFTGGSLTHNGKNVGSDHQHTNVQNGSGISGPPQ